MPDQPPPEGQSPDPPAAPSTPAAAATPEPTAATAAPEAVAAAPAEAVAPAEAAPSAAEPAAPEKLADVAAFESVGSAATAAAAASPDPAAAGGAEAAGVEAEADPVAAAAAEAVAAGAADAENMDNLDVEALLKQANFEDASSVTQSPAADAEPMNLPSFQQVMQDAQVSSIDLLRDVELNVKIELGRNRMAVEDVLKLAEGSVVELDKLAGDPVDVFVNERLVARGEVLVLNDNFCVRVNEIVTGVKEEGL